jgi:hypothetical protein
MVSCELGFSALIQCYVHNVYYTSLQAASMLVGCGGSYTAARSCLEYLMSATDSVKKKSNTGHECMCQRWDGKLLVVCMI